MPPTPFLLKDWERYDVSRFVDPGCVSPEEGRRSDDRSAHDVRWTTIRDDLATVVQQGRKTLGKLGEAEPLYRETLEIYDATLPPDSVIRPGALGGLFVQPLAVMAGSFWYMAHATLQAGAKPEEIDRARLRRVGDLTWSRVTTLTADDYRPTVERLIAGVEHDPALLLEPLDRRIASLAREDRFEEAAWVHERRRALEHLSGGNRRIRRTKTGAKEQNYVASLGPAGPGIFSEQVVRPHEDCPSFIEFRVNGVQFLVQFLDPYSDLLHFIDQRSGARIVLVLLEHGDFFGDGIAPVLE